MPIERKLAAIMFTDIAGYTEQMSKSESKSLDTLEKKRSILKPLLKEYKGTFVKEIGDGTLSYFESAVNAATCAVKLQETTYDDKEMNIRVGIHIGDIVFKDGDVFGGGVNVASRLENIAPAGGVCVSKSVYDELSNQDDFDGIELGLQSLKGVGRLIEVFGLKGDKLNEPKPSDYQEDKVTVHSDDEVPSIAIIPFDNKGADEDVFYAYGISADLISDCSGAGLIRVASKKQIDDAGDLPQDELAKKLDVRYMANGELWRMGDMFQLSVELYDTKDRKVVWSDRWQEKWDNLPTIKGSLSDGLLKALDTKPKVEKKADTTNPEAYEFYLKAKHKYEKRENTDDTGIVRGLLNKAIELDDNLISAKTLLGTTYREMSDYGKAMEIITFALKQAEEIGDKSLESLVLNNLGSCHIDLCDYDKGLDCLNRALTIEEELGDKRGVGAIYHNIGCIYDLKGNRHKALENFKFNHEICKDYDDKRGMAVGYNNIGNIYYSAGDYDIAHKYSDNYLTLSETIGDKGGIAAAFGNKSVYYRLQGNYDKGLDCLNRALTIEEELGNNLAISLNYSSMGLLYIYCEEFENAEDYIEKSLTIQKEIGISDNIRRLRNITSLALIYKILRKQYHTDEIQSLITVTENIDFELFYSLYQLLEDTSYLETVYNQVQEKADNLEPDVKLKFLSYPIPKAIVEEWEKVK